MSNSYFRALALALASVAAAQDVDVDPRPPQTGIPPTRLRVMTFNVWNGGGNVNGGVAKIVSAIEAARADVVGLQESSATAVLVAQELGWESYMPSTGSVAIVSRFPITEWFPLTLAGAGAGARIQLSADPPRDIVLWSCHLSPYPYGPYQACFDGAPVAQIVADQSATQLVEVNSILSAMAPALAVADDVPVFLVGDFNTPSHLDWTAATASTHCGYVVPYPVTLATAQAGLVDAYRDFAPDPALDPGNTWSPIFPFNDDEGLPEPQDRIDQIHYAGAGVLPVSSTVFVTGDPQDWPAHQNNLWPSDHAAVVTELLVAPRDGVALPQPELSLDRAVYASGEPIVATFAEGAGNARDWIGLYPSDEAPGHDSATAWFYTNNKQSAGNGAGPEQGSVVFDASSGPVWPLPPGDYNAYFLCCDGYAVLAGPFGFSVN